MHRVPLPKTVRRLNMLRTIKMVRRPKIPLSLLMRNHRNCEYPYRLFLLFATIYIRFLLLLLRCKYLLFVSPLFPLMFSSPCSFIIYYYSTVPSYLGLYLNMYDLGGHIRDLSSLQKKIVCLLSVRRHRRSKGKLSIV